MPAVDSNKVLAIVFGASEWPRFESLPKSESFKKSALGFIEYVKNTLRVPAENILPLFDTDHSVTELDATIRGFLKDNVVKNGVSDLIIYYTGHGSFTIPDRKYIVMLRSTDKEALDITAYKMSTLSNSLSLQARNIRKWIILDCCSSAAAFVDFQPQAGEVKQVIADEAKKLFPQKGTALLCASSADEVALAPIGDEFTMFSGALLDSLKTGSKDLGEALSLKEIYELVENKIYEIFQGKGVKPEIYFPDQRAGDLALFPFFPNPAKLLDVLAKIVEDTAAQVASLDQRISQISEAWARSSADKRIAELSQTVVQLSENLGKTSSIVEGLTDGQKVMQGKVADLFIESTRQGGTQGSTIDDDVSVEEKRLAKYFGLPVNVWRATPHVIKEKLFSYKDSVLIGIGVSLVLVIGLFISIMQRYVFLSNGMTNLLAFISSVFGIFAFVILFWSLGTASVQAVFRRGNTEAASGQVDEKDDVRWKDYEVPNRALRVTMLPILPTVLLPIQYFITVELLSTAVAIANFEAISILLRNIFSLRPPL